MIGAKRSKRIRLRVDLTGDIVDQGELLSSLLAGIPSDRINEDNMDVRGLIESNRILNQQKEVFEGLILLR